MGASAAEGTEIQIRVNGSTTPARVVKEAFYDPAGERLRM
jgi:glycine cleavage system aminomethyltransferase T